MSQPKKTTLKRREVWINEDAIKMFEKFKRDNESLKAYMENVLHDHAEKLKKKKPTP